MSAMSLRDEVRDAPAYVFRAHPHRVKLDQNEAPEDLPDELREEVLARLRDASWHRYPEMRAESVARRIAERDGWDPSGVVVSPGSNVLIQALVIASGIGRRVATVAPTFAVYASQARLLGARLDEVPLLREGFELDVDGFARVLRHGPGILFLADPAAPTGNRHDDARVAEVLDLASRHGWMAVVDEAYAAFDGRDRSDLVRGREDRVLLRTFSKADGLGGVRLGYALTEPDTARHLGKVLLPFDVSALQAALARVVLDDPRALAARSARIDAVGRERRRVAARLAARPELEVYPSVTNFLLIRCADAAWLHGALLDRGVLIRRQDHLPGLDGCLRVSIGTPEDNDAFLEALDEAFADRDAPVPVASGGDARG